MSPVWANRYIKTILYTQIKYSNPGETLTLPNTGELKAAKNFIATNPRNRNPRELDPILICHKINGDTAAELANKAK